MCSSCLSEPSVAASLVAEFLGSLARLPEQDITEIMTVVYYFGVSPHLRFTCQWDWDLGRVRGVCEKPLCTEFETQIPLKKSKVLGSPPISGCGTTPTRPTRQLAVHVDKA